MKIAIVLIGIFTCCFMFVEDNLFGKKERYITTDISHFWEATDSLKNARNTVDSLQFIQTIYLDRMSSEGQKFIQIREYTAAEYLRTIRKYPKYLKQLREKTKTIAIHLKALDSTFKLLENGIPDYEVPRVCFAIGCFRGGGTTKRDLILMGSEIALADTTMDYSEFKGNLKSNLSKGVNLNELVAHESIHCQQHHAKNRTLLSITLQEGAANFLPALILKQGRPSDISPYESEHECALWKEFKPDINSNDLSKWLFNTGSIQNRPPDLGYFIGMRICEAYYKNQINKSTAIKNLLDRSKYMEVMEQSGYVGNCNK
jgi:hypothetical protein